MNTLFTEVTMATDDANIPTPEPPNNDLMIKTLQDLQASIKSDFGNFSEQIQTMDKTLKDVKTTVDQAIGFTAATEMMSPITV